MLFQNYKLEIRMGQKKYDGDDIPIQQLQQKAKKFIFLVSSCYLKICEELNTKLFYLLTLIETLQILWFSFHPNLTFLKEPLLLDYIRQILSYSSFQNFVLQDPNTLSTFLIISFVVVLLSLVAMAVSIIFIIKNKDSQIAKMIHKSATVLFLLNNTIFTVPFIGIAGITLYCTQQSPYHKGRQCYDIEHLIYCVMAGLVAIVLILESLAYCFIFYIKNPFSRCFLANPNNLWKIAKVLVKAAPPIYFAIDYENSLQNVYVFAYLAINAGYFLFFRFLSLTWYNKKHLYFCMVLESTIVWFGVFNVINYYLNVSETGSLSLIQAILICVLFVYLIYTIQKAISQKIFIDNLKSNKIKKQNIQKFFYSLIDMQFNYTKSTKNMLLVAVKLLNSKATTCNIRVAQLFKNKELKPEQQLNILNEFFIMQCDYLLQQNPSINILKVIKCHLLFKIGQKILSIHDLVELEHEKLNFAEQFMIYQFKQTYDVFSENYQKQVFEQNNLVTVYFSFNGKMNQFENLIRQCTENNKQYWEELIEDNPSLIKLRDLASCYVKIMNKVKVVFSELSTIFPNNLKSIYYYQKFLLYVGIDSKQLMRLRQKLQLQTCLLSDQAQGLQQSLIKFRQNDNLGVISIDTTQSSFGTINACNNEIKNYLGYTRKQLLGSKVTKIMPKIFNEIHDNFIRKFIKNEDSTVYPSEKVVFALNKDGLLIQTALYIKIIPDEEKAFQIVGFFRQIRHIDRNPAVGFISMNTKNIEGVNQAFIDLVNRPIDFSNLSKQPIPLITFVPNFQFKFNMKPGDSFETELTYNNASDKMLQLQQASKQPSRLVNIKIINVKYFDTVPMAFFQMQQKSNDNIQILSNNSQLNQQTLKHNRIKRQYTTQLASLKQLGHSSQFLEQLPIQRKLQQFVNSNNRNSQFICMRLLIAIFATITICSSVGMFGINKIFESQVMQIFKATNLTMSIAALNGRVNTLSAKALSTQISTPILQFRKVTNQLSNNSQIMKTDIVDLIRIAYQYNYSLEINENNFYEFTILRETTETPRIKSNQSFVDGLLKFVGSGMSFAQIPLQGFITEDDETIETYWYIQINGRQLLPSITLETADRFTGLFDEIMVNQLNIQLNFLIGKGVLVLITFVVLSIIMLKLNSFNLFTIDLYNNVYLWDINELIHKCTSFTREYSDNDSIATAKQIQNEKYRDSNILNFFPKHLFVDIIEESRKHPHSQNQQTPSVEDNNQENSLLENEPVSSKKLTKKKKKSMKRNSKQYKGISEKVTIEQTYNLKKTLVLILLITILLIGIVVGFYFWVSSSGQSISERQHFIQVLGRIRKNIQFIRYYSLEILENRFDSTLYRSLLSVQMANLHQNAAFFFKVIGDPNPILKSVYSQIEQIKSITTPDPLTNQMISPKDAKFKAIQTTLQQNTIKLSQLTHNQFKLQEKQILQSLNLVKIFRIVADVIAALILIIFLDNCYFSPLRKNVMDSINMIKMLPVWLVIKNKYVRQALNA